MKSTFTDSEEYVGEISGAAAIADAKKMIAGHLPEAFKNMALMADSNTAKQFYSALTLEWGKPDGGDQLSLKFNGRIVALMQFDDLAHTHEDYLEVITLELLKSINRQLMEIGMQTLVAGSLTMFKLSPEMERRSAVNLDDPFPDVLAKINPAT